MTSYRAIAYLLVAVVAVGCSNSGMQNPISSEGPVGSATSPQNAAASRDNHYLWGLWGVRIDANKQTADVIPLRMADIHLNVVRKLEFDPCTDCLRIHDVVWKPPDEIEVNVTLRHPYPGALKFTGFDVRGIFISGADYAFPVNGRSIAWGDTYPKLLNPDGYTSLFNPTEFPETMAVPPILKYHKGKYAPGGDLSATLNPYIAYGKEAPRRMFDTIAVETLAFRLKIPAGSGGVIEFGYAVDASWRYVEEVTDPVYDFPSNANCIEAYVTKAIIKNELATGTWSYMPVGVVAYDHQGFGTISTVTVESPELFNGEVTLDFIEENPGGGFIYEGIIGNELAAQPGEYPLLVRVVDTKSDPNLGQIDAWNVGAVRVARGWAQTWGGNSNDYGFAVAIDENGNIYIAGSFQLIVDFDPSLGFDEHSTNGGVDAFLSKFDPNGGFLWARTWGGSYSELAIGIAIDGSGNAYVTGSFQKTVDFDPGPAVDEHTSNGDSDIFLSKFDSDGGFQWAHTWGGPIDIEEGRGVVIDKNGGVYVTGFFVGTADFNPGPGVDEHVSNGKEDIFLSKFDSDAVFQWTRTWGGIESDAAYGIAIDGISNCYITGRFKTSIDFDPSPGIDNHTSNGGSDAFLSKFDPGGNFQWVQVWGGSGFDVGYGVDVDISGNAYITGVFEATTDFDPGPGVEVHTSNGSQDIFLSKLASNGNFLWAHTWGGIEDDNGHFVAADETGNIYITGWFKNDVDFDPGLEADIHTSNGNNDIFLSKFSLTGDFLWAKSWGGFKYDEGYEVAIDANGNAYVTGTFEKTVDFDPSSGIDEHISNGDDEIFLCKFPPDGNW